MPLSCLSFHRQFKCDESFVRSLCVRLVSLVVRLREWAHRSLLEEEERPDSFLERFRGPELRKAPSRISNTQPDADGNAKGIFRYARPPACHPEPSLCILIYT